MRRVRVEPPVPPATNRFPLSPAVWHKKDTLYVPAQCPNDQKPATHYRFRGGEISDWTDQTRNLLCHACSVRLVDEKMMDPADIHLLPADKKELPVSRIRTWTCPVCATCKMEYARWTVTDPLLGQRPLCGECSKEYDKRTQLVIEVEKGATLKKNPIRRLVGPGEYFNVVFTK